MVDWMGSLSHLLLNGEKDLEGSVSGEVVGRIVQFWAVSVFVNLWFSWLFDVLWTALAGHPLSMCASLSLLMRFLLKSSVVKVLLLKCGWMVMEGDEDLSSPLIRWACAYLNEGGGGWSLARVPLGCVCCHDPQGRWWCYSSGSAPIVRSSCSISCLGVCSHDAIGMVQVPGSGIGGKRGILRHLISKSPSCPCVCWGCR